MSHMTRHFVSLSTLFLSAFLATGCSVPAGSSSSATSLIPYSDAMEISYKNTTFTNFLPFLQTYISQPHAMDWSRVCFGQDTPTPYYATEDIHLNNESIFHTHTVVTDIEDPFNPGSSVPFYQRYQTALPEWTTSDFYFTRIGSQEPFVLYSPNMIYYRLFEYDFYSKADGSGATEAGFAGYSAPWYNPLIENIYTNVINDSVIADPAHPVLSNFSIIRQDANGFEVALDILSWRLYYIDANFAASLLKDQYDFNSTVTLNFSFSYADDELHLSFDPSKTLYLPYSNQYSATATDEVTVDIVYHMGKVDYNTFPESKSFEASDLTSMVRDAWVAGGSSGQFLK